MIFVSFITNFIFYFNHRLKLIMRDVDALAHAEDDRFELSQPMDVYELAQQHEEIRKILLKYDLLSYWVI